MASRSLRQYTMDGEKSFMMCSAQHWIPGRALNIRSSHAGGCRHMKGVQKEWEEHSLSQSSCRFLLVQRRRRAHTNKAETACGTWE